MEGSRGSSATWQRRSGGRHSRGGARAAAVTRGAIIALLADVFDEQTDFEVQTSACRRRSSGSNIGGCEYEGGDARRDAAWDAITSPPPP